MHWSGCPAGCGNHLVADIGLLGKRIKRGNEVIDAVDIYMGGRTGTHPKLATKVMEDVPCDQLAKVLEFVTPYHTRQKMHPIKGKKYSKKKKSPNKSEQTNPKRSANSEQCISNDDKSRPHLGEGQTESSGKRVGEDVPLLVIPPLKG
jgi:ferredoxin-nitrite reductase